MAANTELVRTTTRDGLRLDGALYEGQGDARVALDGVILLHGVTSNFYGGGMFDHVVARLQELGVAALRVNTRGRDSVYPASTPSGRRQFGAAYEIIDDCRLDIAAWVDFLAERGLQRIGLLGHSLGAIKALYYAAKESDDRLAAVAAMSPPCLSFRLFRDSDRSQPFLASMAEAERMRLEQRGQDLFVAKFPFPLLISADTYADKYGSMERYNILRFLPRVRCPTWMAYGERELQSGGTAFEGLLDRIQQLPELPGSIDFRVVEDADHFYTGVHAEAADLVAKWLESRF